MRFIAFFAFCALVASTGCQSTSNSSPSLGTMDGFRSDTTPLVSSGAVLQVHGMSCPKCANNIERQLRTLDGVGPVRIDMSNGVVDIRFDGSHSTSRADLATAIDDAGFTVVDVQAHE